MTPDVTSRTQYHAGTVYTNEQVWVDCTAAYLSHRGLTHLITNQILKQIQCNSEKQEVQAVYIHHRASPLTGERRFIYSRHLIFQHHRLMSQLQQHTASVRPNSNNTKDQMMLTTVWKHLHVHRSRLPMSFTLICSVSHSSLFCSNWIFRFDHLR